MKHPIPISADRQICSKRETPRHLLLASGMFGAGLDNRQRKKVGTIEMSHSTKPVAAWLMW